MRTMEDKDILQNAVNLAAEGLDDFQNASSLLMFNSADIKKVKVILSLFKGQSLGDLRRFIIAFEGYIQVLADGNPVITNIETDLGAGPKKIDFAKELLLKELRNDFKPFEAREKVYDSNNHDGLESQQDFLDKCISFLKP